jgi:hypothetical protein
LASTPQATNRDIFVVEAKTNPRRAPLSRASLAAIRWPYKLIQYSGYKDVNNGYELYNLETDPQELQNIYSPNDPVAQALIEALASNRR